jgi:hypothetical protein
VRFKGEAVLLEEFLIKVLISTIELSALLLLALSLFRFSLRYAYVKVFVIAVCISFIVNYLRIYADMIQYSTTSLVLVCTILVMIFFRIPLFYSIVICLTFILLAGTLESAYVVVGTLAGWTSGEKIISSAWHMVIMDSTIAFICLLLVLFLRKKKIGFVFIIKRKNLGNFIKTYNFILASVAVVIQLICQNYALLQKKDTYNIYFVFSFSFLLIIFLYISYKRNRSDMEVKYRLLDRKNKNGVLSRYFSSSGRKT